jgi:ubiquitin-conjugating enzyme E2 S
MRLTPTGGTPYEGGFFKIRFDFGPEYPNLPPKCEYRLLLQGHSDRAVVWRVNVTDTVGTMMTRIFHPNVSKAGEICVDTLKKSWNKKYGVGHVLVVRIQDPYLRYRSG